MKRKIFLSVFVVALAALAIAIYLPAILTNCSGEKTVVEDIKPVGPAFSADSAYAFCQAQCDFGSRAMNTDGHGRCKDWIIGKFKQYGCEVTTQEADLKGYDGTVLHATNIIAKYRPELTTRILLCAHWDSRPWADNDPDEANWHKPILAANDAASGVAVMLEIARLLSSPNTQDSSLITHHPSPEIGIDFVCFDAEDWGTPQWAENQSSSENTWALGSTYFAQNLPERYEVRYGILLDMVGGQGAKFYQEGISLQFASAIVEKVWRAAEQAGFASYFPKTAGGQITDDHLPLNRYARIPTVDIIPYYPDCPQSSFGPTWHTLADDMQHIDRNTLKAVGQTVVQVIWTEN
ncbi:MAG: M28 family peptidase [Prevotella sp.]|nr:M28 family peptidase [Prevotella sp.]